MAGGPPGNGRRTRHEGRREELLAAATDYVFEHGLASLSLRPLAAALGLSHRTLIYHFGSKGQLFTEILVEAQRRARVSAEAQAARAGRPTTFSELLRRVWHDRMNSPEEDRFWRFHFEVHGLALQDPERYGGVWTAGTDEWVSSMARFLVHRGWDASRARSLATVVYATFRGLRLELWSTGDRNRVGAAFEEFVRTVETLEASEEQSRIAAVEEGESP